MKARGTRVLGRAAGSKPRVCQNGAPDATMNQGSWDWRDLAAFSGASRSCPIRNDRVTHAKKIPPLSVVRGAT